MKRVKKLGRGLEDFSHLFLSSRDEKSGPLSSTKQDAVCERRDTVTPARVICITGDKKVGERAFLTVNLALEIAKQGKRVLVFDADFSLPRLCMLMDIPAHSSVLHFISKNGEDEIIVEGVNGVTLITLDVDISDLRSLGESERRSLMKCFKSAEDQADILLVTTSPSFIHHMRAVLKASGDIIVTAPQQVNEMINAYGVIKTIFQVNKDARVGIVSSRIDAPHRAEAVFEKMQKIVKKFLDKPLYNYGYIPEDTEITLSMTRRKPLSLSSPSSETIRCITEISQSILEMDGRERENHAVGENQFSFTEKLFNTSFV
ncbi:MAG: AAA family ATPase [Thermodesulfobacteriota bacterium]